MPTLGLSFSGLTQEEVNELRAKLNELFGRLGYATDQPANPYRERRKPWAGGLSHGLVALGKGELAVVPLPRIDEVEDTINDLRDRLAPESDYPEAVEAYADALQQALDQAVASKTVTD